MAGKAFGNVLEEMFGKALGKAPRVAVASSTVRAECLRAKPGGRIGFVLPAAAAFPGLDRLGDEELDLAAAAFDAVASMKLLPAC